jgi:protein-L-isoaspartate(D-aspartate) O-methyltransferase
MLDFAQARRTMVDSQIRTYDVTDRAVLDAVGATPRERFVPAGRETLAYCDLSIPLTDPHGTERRVMLAPMVLARMVQALDLKPGQRVLDVATGLGYAAAVMARLGADVIAIESEAALADAARVALAGIGGVIVKTGPLLEGSRGEAPFDAILVNGGVHARPDTLLEQLKEGGRLACISQSDGAGKALLYVRSGDAFGSRSLFEANAPELAEARPAPAFVF